MGNTCLASTNKILAIAAMSKYMHLTKQQVISLRNTLIPFARKLNGFLRRSHVEYASNVVGIADQPDTQIVSLLFTMWDMSGSGKVNYNDFIVGLSVLACENDTYENALRFALDVMDIKRTGQVKSRDAFTVLKSICTTSSYLGDSLMTPRQIYKLVDAIYDTITLISSEDDDITQDKFIEVLASKPMVRAIVSNSRRSVAAQHFYVPGQQRTARDSPAFPSNPRNLTIPEDEELSYGPTLVSTPQSVGHASYHTDNTSHMSSLLLTPLTKMRIG